MDLIKRIYLDNNATTCMDRTVLEEYTESLKNCYGNPSSTHHFGQEAHVAIVTARRRIAAFFSAKPEEVVFFASATEALNTLIHSLIKNQKSRVVLTNLEHSAVITTLESRQKEFHHITWVYPKSRGALTVEELDKAVTDQTQAVIVMASNNETGILTPLEEISEYCYARKLLLIVDGVALIGKSPFSFYRGISAFCCSAHKFHGPKGLGIAIVKKNFPFTPLIYGGGQESRRRGGTENTPAIVATAKALKIVQEGGDELFLNIARKRDFFEMQLLERLEHITIIGKEFPRVTNTSNICFEGIDAEAMIMALDMAGICASHGSACASGGLEPSKILLGMGIASSLARSCIRFSLSRMTTDEELVRAVEIIVTIVTKLRSMILTT